jgi:hypothetical protein
MCDLIKCAIILAILYYIYQNSNMKTNKQEVIILRDDGYRWESPPYLRNRYLPTVN